MALGSEAAVALDEELAELRFRSQPVPPGVEVLELHRAGRLLVERLAAEDDRAVAFQQFRGLSPAGPLGLEAHAGDERLKLGSHGAGVVDPRRHCSRDPLLLW
ncbi:MAG: hypothetical protein ACRDRK_10660 [Pseudonocardia sp.]